MKRLLIVLLLAAILMLVIASRIGATPVHHGHPQGQYEGQLHVLPASPPNDDFENATVITSFPYDTSEATVADDDPITNCTI